MGPAADTMSVLVIAGLAIVVLLASLWTAAGPMSLAYAVVFALAVAQ